MTIFVSCGVGCIGYLIGIWHGMYIKSQEPCPHCNQTSTGEL